MADFYEMIYPPANRFMVSFTSMHLCVGGHWTTQNQRRFLLADNANSAMAYIRAHELDNARLWDGKFHKWQGLSAANVPQACAWAGYPRFSVDARGL